MDDDAIRRALTGAGRRKKAVSSAPDEEARPHQPRTSPSAPSSGTERPLPVPECDLGQLRGGRPAAFSLDEDLRTALEINKELKRLYDRIEKAEKHFEGRKTCSEKEYEELCWLYWRISEVWADTIGGDGMVDELRERQHERFKARYRAMEEW